MHFLLDPPLKCQTVEHLALLLIFAVIIRFLCYRYCNWNHIKLSLSTLLSVRIALDFQFTYQPVIAFLKRLVHKQGEAAIPSLTTCYNNSYILMAKYYHKYVKMLQILFL